MNSTRFHSSGLRPHTAAVLRSYVCAFLLLVWASALTGCLDSLCEEIAVLPENSSYCVVGDSLMQAYEKDPLNTDLCQHVAGRLSWLVGEKIPSFAESGAQLSGGTRTEIPVQYEIAREYAKDNSTTLDTVIFDGGGNDLLKGENWACTSLGPEDPSCETLLQECDEAGALSPQCKCCNIIDSVEEELHTMVDQMNVDNVDRIIYVGPYQPQGPFAEYQEALTRTMNRIRPRCRDYDVTFLDLEGVFAGHYSEYMHPDNLHPNPEGVQAIAEALYEIL